MMNNDDDDEGIIFDVLYCPICGDYPNSISIYPMTHNKKMFQGAIGCVTCKIGDSHLLGYHKYVEALGFKACFEKCVDKWNDEANNIKKEISEIRNDKEKSREKFENYKRQVINDIEDKEILSGMQKIVFKMMIGHSK